MEVIGQPRLVAFMKKHAQSEGRTAALLAELERAEWETPQQVRERYGDRVSFTPKGNAVFRIGGNKYRVVVRVAFNTQRAVVVWAGTHAESNRKDF